MPLGKQFNFDDSNCVGAAIKASDHFYGLVLVLPQFSRTLQLVSRVSGHLQNVLASIFHNLSGERLRGGRLLRGSLRLGWFSLPVLLVGLRDGLIPGWQRLRRRLRLLDSSPRDQLLNYQGILGGLRRRL